MELRCLTLFITIACLVDVVASCTPPSCGTFCTAKCPLTTSTPPNCKCDTSLYKETSTYDCTTSSWKCTRLCTYVRSSPYFDVNSCAGLGDGDTCTPSCSAGTSGSSFTLSCPSGSHYTSSTVCTPNSCSWYSGSIPASDLTFEQCDRVKSFGTCTPTCVKPGYFYDGVVSPTCDTSGSYDVPADVSRCKPAVCSAPAPGGDAARIDYRNCIGKSTGEKCAVQCNSGHKQLKADLDLVCNAGGTFPIPSGFCEPYRCTVPPYDKANGANFDKCIGKVTGDSCPDFTCPRFHEKVTSYTLNCRKDGTFKDNPCFPSACTDGLFNGIQHANVTECLKLRFGDECANVCEKGYWHKGGNLSLECEPVEVSMQGVRRYIVNSFVCEPRECTGGEASGLDKNAIWEDCVGKKTGEECVPKCKQGYRFTGNPITLFCGDDNKFTMGVVCQPYECKKELDVQEGVAPGGYESCNAKVSGMECSPQCKNGYHLASPFTLKCNDKGEYRTDGSQCEPNLCTGGPANQPPGGEPINWKPCSTKSTGEECTPKCSKGFSLRGNSKITLVCDSSQRYDVGDTRCERNVCLTPKPADQHGVYDCIMRRTGDGCTLTCPPGMRYEGAGGLTSLVCDAAGEFDATAAGSCHPNECRRPRYVDPRGTGYEDCTSGKRTGGRCQVKCTDGWVAVGTIELVCAEDGTFDSMGSRCSRLDCVEPAEEDENGNFTVCNSNSLEKRYSGYPCTPRCAPGYYATTFEQRCVNGTYDIVPCKPYKCSGGPWARDPLPTASYASCDKLSSGERCAPDCGRYHYANPLDFRLVCNANGTYDATLSRCVPAACTGGAVEVANKGGRGGVNTTDFTLCDKAHTGVRCFPICKQGYEAPEPFLLECDRYTQKYNASSYCTPYQCTKGLAMPVANLVDSSICDARVTGQVCRGSDDPSQSDFKCSPGYNATGELSLVCTHNLTYHAPPGSISCKLWVCSLKERVVDHKCKPCGKWMEADHISPASDNTTLCHEVVRFTEFPFFVGRASAMAISGCNLMDPHDPRPYEVPWVLHPTRFRIPLATVKNEQLVGCVVGNHLFVIAVWGGAKLLKLVATRFERFRNFKLNNIRYPGIVAYAYMVLLDGIVYSGARMAIEQLSVGEAVLGGLAVAGALLYVFAVWYWWLRLSRFGGMWISYSNRKNIKMFLLGFEEWANRDELFCDKYGLVFEAYEEENRCFFLYEVVFSIVVCMAAAIPGLGTEYCRVKYWGLTCALFLGSALMVWRRPFIQRFLDFVGMVTYTLQFGALLITAVLYELDEADPRPVHKHADRMFLAAGAIFMLKVAQDSIKFFFTVFIGDASVELRELKKDLHLKRLEVGRMEEVYRDDPTEENRLALAKKQNELHILEQAYDERIHFIKKNTVGALYYYMTNMRATEGEMSTSPSFRSLSATQNTTRIHLDFSRKLSSSKPSFEADTPLLKVEMDEF
eukprot:Sspe_Gene.36078::Locus_17459_Transcript_1_1_Confidence_1.000_Length_4404::g.36078::m.36078